MNSIKNYLNEKILECEDMTGDMTKTEKIKVRNEFLQKFTNFADEININVFDILDDFYLMVELDKLIDYDFETAKETALKKLS